MTVEEFKKIFKVGDLIRGSWWLDPYDTEKITAIGEKSFLTVQPYADVERQREIVCVGEDNCWIKVEPEKVPMKPSIEIIGMIKKSCGTHALNSVRAIDYCILDWLDANWPRGK